MAQNETSITVVGNLVEDPSLRFTPGGDAVCNFRVASTPSKFNRQTNQFEDGEPLFLAVNIWKQPAENAAESLTKGMRVLVSGVLSQRSYETREGEKRTVFEVSNAEVGASLRYATAQVTRTPKGGNQNQNQQQSGGGFSNQGQQYGSAQGQGQQQGNFGQAQQNVQQGLGGQQAGFNDQPPY